MLTLPRRFDNADPTVRRFDVGTGDLLRMVKREADGAIHLEGIPVREGILVYRRADGTERRELVTRQAVIDTMAGLRRAVVTLEHPVNDAGEAEFVSRENVGKYQAGDTGDDTEVVIDDMGGFGVVKITARRKDACEAIEGGTAVELSPGYGVQLDETPGEDPVFGRFDARQVGREINHLAIVSRGRGGPTVRLRTDSADAVQIGRSPPRSVRTDNSEAHMKPNLVALLTLLGVTRLDDEGAAIQAGTDAVKGLQASAKKRSDADEAAAAAGESEKDKEIAALKADLAAANGKCDELTTEMAAMKKEKQDRADAAELTRLQGVAEKLNVRHDGLDLPALRKALALTRVDSIDGRTPEAVAAILDIVVKDASRADAEEATRWDWGTKPGEVREDGKPAKPGEKPAPRSRYLDHLDEARASVGGSK